MLLIESVIPTILSILCSIILILVWILNPKWRSLHNFISIHQIVFGTLQLCVIHLNIGLWRSVTLSTFFLPATLCWSLCASILAYVRLVFLVTGKISYGKRKAAAFSYGTLSILLILVKIIIPNIFGLRPDSLEAAVAGAYFLVLLNCLIILKVMSSVVPCCKKRISRTGGTRTLSLIGIAILSDIVISITMLVPFLSYFNFLFDYRLIPHAIIILFNRSSIDYFKKQRERRKKQRAVQEIKL